MSNLTTVHRQTLPRTRLHRLLGQLVQWYFTPFLHPTFLRLSARRKQFGKSASDPSWSPAHTLVRSLPGLLLLGWLAGEENSNPSWSRWGGRPLAEGAVWQPLAVWGLFAAVHQFSRRTTSAGGHPENR